MISIEGKKRIMIAGVFILIGLLLGFYIGSYLVTKAVAKVAARFIDPSLVERAIWQYDNSVCFLKSFPLPINLTNAPNYSNKGE